MNDQALRFLLTEKDKKNIRLIPPRFGAMLILLHTVHSLQVDLGLPRSHAMFTLIIRTPLTPYILCLKIEHVYFISC